METNQTKNALTKQMLTKAHLWSEQEEVLFLYMHSIHGNQWVALSRMLNNKTDNDTKNHFYTMLKKQVSKVLANDYQFQNQIEIIQGLYYTNYVSEYFNSPTKLKKDYMYNIICDKKINKETTDKYCQQMRKEYPYFLNLDIKTFLKNTYTEGLKSYDFKKIQQRHNADLAVLMHCPLIDYQDKIYFIESWLTQLKAQMKEQQSTLS